MKYLANCILRELVSFQSNGNVPGPRGLRGHNVFKEQSGGQCDSHTCEEKVGAGEFMEGVPNQVSLGFIPPR